MIDKSIIIFQWGWVNNGGKPGTLWWTRRNQCFYSKKKTNMEKYIWLSLEAISGLKNDQTSLYSILHTMNWACNLRDDHSVFLQIQNLNNFTKNVLKVRIASFWFNWWLNQNFSVPHSINQCSCHCWLELDTSLNCLLYTSPSPRDA